MVRKQPDDEVFAGSTLQRGELQIDWPSVRDQILRPPHWPAQPWRRSRPRTAREPRRDMATFAERSVAPTLAMAGLGLLVGDVTTAGAILRPDYATGPGLAFPLETMQVIALCIRHGIVIRDSAVIERLATTDLLILDHLPRSNVPSWSWTPSQPSPAILRKSCSVTPQPPFMTSTTNAPHVLLGECNARGIALLGLQPTDFATDVSSWMERSHQGR